MKWSKNCGPGGWRRGCERRRSWDDDHPAPYFDMPPLLPVPSFGSMLFFMLSFFIALLLLDS